VRDLLTQLQNESTQTSLDNQAASKVARVFQLTQDLSGLQHSFAVDEARYGDFMKAFEQLAPSFEVGGSVIVTPQPPLSVSAADAHYSLPSPLLSGMVVTTAPLTPWRIQTLAGETLNIQTSGAWSPTCALGKTSGPSGALVNVAGASTGPEGFMVTTSNATYTATGEQTVNTNGKYENWTRSASICAGFEISTGLSFIGTGSKAYVRVEACAGYQAGNTWQRNTSNTDGKGNETRSSIATAHGVRSPLAPFPDQPVGSLLVVQVLPGGTLTSHVLDVRVVQSPSTAILSNSNADVYLVVNDLGAPDCPIPPTPASLTLQISKLTPASLAARQLTTAMVNAHAALQAQSATIVAQGRVLPSQLNLLRSTAYQKVFDQCLCTTLAGYPEGLRNLFDTWVTKELVHIEREVELVNIERQIKLLLMDLRAISDDLNAATAQARMIALMPAWDLRNLDGAQLRSQTQQLIEVMNNWIWPVIHLRNPETLSTFTVADLALLDALTSVSPTSVMVDLATAANNAAQMVGSRLSGARTAAPTPTLRDVAVSFPRTDKPVVSFWRKVDVLRAQAVWKSILAGGNAVLSLKPEDVYSAPGGPGILTCSSSTPIINSLSLFLAHSTASTWPNWDVASTLTSGFLFPTALGQESFTFTNAAYLAPTPTMLFGRSDAALTTAATFWTLPGRQVAAGLSPFSDVFLDLSSFGVSFPTPPGSPPGTISPASPLSLANELIVVMRLEPRDEAPGTLLPGTPGCQ
jgi:hypothetical protein